MTLRRSDKPVVDYVLFSEDDLFQIAEERRDEEAVVTQPIMGSIQQTKQELLSLEKRIHDRVNEQKEWTNQQIRQLKMELGVQLEEHKREILQMHDLLKKIESLLEQRK